MKDYTITTLGQLLTHHNETIRRLAMSILKLLQRNATPKDPELKRQIERIHKQYYS